MRNIILSFFACFFLIIAPKSFFAQNFNEYEGLPYVKNYTPKIYHAHGQNFDIAQDRRGIMYFANFAGILEYDGSVWQTIPTSSGLRVLSLDVDTDGNVYAGGLSDFGFIKHRENGTSVFISLADSLKDDVGMIFKVLCKDSTSYFLSEKVLYIYENSEIKTIRFKSKAKTAFLYAQDGKQKDLYVFFERDLKNETNVQNGLTIFKNNTFKRIQDNSSAQIIDVKSVFPLSGGNTLILGTASQGMFLLKNNTVSDFDVSVNDLIKQYGHTCGTKISKHRYALGTLTHGVLIVSDKGNVIQNIDKGSYLQDESINDLFLDENGSLWVAENDGISKIEVNWDLSYIDNKNTGLEGKVQDIIKYAGILYFATDKGLFYLNGSEIKKVKGINFACKDLEIVNQTLLAAGAEGLFIVNDALAKATEYNDFAFCLKKLKDENQFLVGYTGKFEKFNIKNDKISLIKSIKTVEGDVFKTEETKDGIYAEISPGRIFFFPEGSDKGTELKPNEKFPALHLNRNRDDVFISSEKGLYQYKNSRLEPFNLFPEDTSSHNLWIYDFYDMGDKNYIVTDGEQKNIAFCTEKDKKIKLIQTPFLPIADFSVNAIYFSDNTNILWFGGNDGLVLYRTKGKMTGKNSQSVIIRKIMIMNEDSLLVLNNKSPLKLASSENSLQFDFSAPVYVSKGEVQYRWFLKGFDKDTSDWQKQTHKEYTNLPGGEYTFIVEAKNEFGQVLKPAEFQFEILTPVWLRWWMFIFYVAGLFFIVRAYMNWRMKSVEKERIILENTVKERTEEIEQSKEEIETQRDELYKQKQEIVDSINYAKRIQQAVLPSEELLNDVLHDYFVFFKPRDIVSGDFFWVKKIRNFSFVVAADCTGHGVPGAFMSMLGSSFLNEIVSSRTLDSAAEILNRLRNKVKKSLHQKGEEGEQKDGMDISLLIIDWDSSDLQFAGAYNSLYIVRKKEDSEESEDAYEVIKLKADRQPIGIYLHEKDFTNHSFKLKKGDTLYALSDGYVDQFGGDTGGKFKSGRFQKMLLSFQDKSMDEQKQILIRTFTKWKRDFEQVDDVLVMGIRV